VKKDRIVLITRVDGGMARSSASSFFANGDPDRSLAANVAVGSAATELRCRRHVRCSSESDRIAAPRQVTERANSDRSGYLPIRSKRANSGPGPRQRASIESNAPRFPPRHSAI